MSSVWDMILQWGSTIKVSIELPVATRHRRDMTEKLLKATLNPNTHTHPRHDWKKKRFSASLSAENTIFPIMLQWKEIFYGKKYSTYLPYQNIQGRGTANKHFKGWPYDRFQFSTLNYQCLVLTQMWAHITTKLLRTESFTTKLSKVGRNDQG